MEFKYKYTEIKGTESQYSNVVFEIGVPVEAVYIKSKVDIDQGNPFIEALPMPRIENEVTLAYERGLPNYKLDEAIKFSKLDKMLQLETLKNLRFALPFHKELEIKFYNALLVCVIFLCLLHNEFINGMSICNKCFIINFPLRFHFSYNLPIIIPLLNSKTAKLTISRYSFI